MQNVSSDPKSSNEHDKTGEEYGGDGSVVKNPSNAEIMKTFKGMEKQVCVKIVEVLRRSRRL